MYGVKIVVFEKATYYGIEHFFLKQITIFNLIDETHFIAGQLNVKSHSIWLSPSQFTSHSYNLKLMLTFI